MLHIHLIVLGKLKEQFWQAAEAEYLKRLQAFAKITIHELKEESFNEKDPPEMIKQKEALKITAELDKIKDTLVFVLDEHGKHFTSPQWAAHLQKQFNNYTTITFILGGPLGLHQSILDISEKISLSAFTFTHQMARVILIEQLYRAFMINGNRRYHY